MSFSNIELSLDSKCYVIQGRNEDNKGQQSNGAGKTSLLDIIAVGLLGQSLTGRDLKKCVNRYSGESSFTVELQLKGEHSLSITRTVYNNTRSQELVLKFDDKPVEGVPSKSGVHYGVDVKGGNAWILQILGISKEDLLNYFLISRLSYKGFLSSNNTDKIAVISRFSNASLVDKAIISLEVSRNEVDDVMRQDEIDISNLEGQIQGLTHSISEEAHKEFLSKKQIKLDQLSKQLGDTKQQLDQLLKENSHLGQQLFECEEYYGRLSDDQLKNTREEINSLSIILRDIDRQIAELRNKLLGQIQCPNCHHLFIIDSQTSVSELNDELQQAELAKVEVQNGIDVGKDVLEGDQLLKSIEATIDQYSLRHDRIVDQINTISNSLKLVEQEQFSVASQEINVKIQQLRQQVLERTQHIELLLLTKQQCETWIERFERFKFFLINKPISLITALTNRILKQIGSDYAIEIEGFKKLKSGELRAELTPIVYINGVEGESYASFSAGEQTRLNLACDLAIQQMINTNSKGGLNLYINDEEINSLDSQGLAQVAKAFNCLDKTILLISHSGSELNYENIITVHKKGKQSILI